MPRKVDGERQDRVVSTKVSAKQYAGLENLAKELYLKKILSQPNMAQVLNHILKRVLSDRAEAIAKSDLNGTSQNMSSYPNTGLETGLERQSSVNPVDPSTQSLKSRQSKTLQEFEKELYDI